ncbi:hypothetical protein [Phreatobacter stygius]|uniref:PRC-barrel domain containing protein n=1 Tax=Phreatobacter stygius TaxID=1940610 RepID=A0A4D7BCV3_9HYPH|nr:hypothetical protein [Phreatobacter stygius]QCI68515.1 hypothetical protein E8M01_32385 [Phreatobacter stygius]
MRIRTLIALAALTAVTATVHAQASAPTLARNEPAVDAGNAQPRPRPGELSLRGLLTAKIYTPKLGTAATGSASTRAAPSTREPAGGAGHDATASSVPTGRRLTMAEAEWQTLRQTYDHVGDLTDVAVSDEGRIRQIVVKLSPSLGLGEKSATIDWSDINWIVSASGDLAGVVDRSKLQLEAAAPAR